MRGLCISLLQGYYKRTPDYIPILTWAKVGHFKVPVLYSAFLIDMTTPQARGVAFWPLAEGFTGPVDDVVHFAYSAKKEGAQLLWCLSRFPSCQ